MKITQQELIEFADQNDLQIFGKSNMVISKLRAIQRLINKDLLPKPKWEGGTYASYWEDDTKIKDRVMWLDEQKQEGKSYRQMKDELDTRSVSQSEDQTSIYLLRHIKELSTVSEDQYIVQYMKAIILYQVGKRDEGIGLLRDIKKNCTGNKKLVYMVCEELAGIYDNYNDKIHQLEESQKLVELAKEMGSDEKLGRAYCMMGRYYKLIDVDKASEYVQRSFKLLEGTDSLGEAYESMYWIYSFKKDYDKAAEYASKAAELFSKSNNNNGAVCCRANLGAAYIRLNKLDEALVILKEVHNDCVKFKDLDGQAATLGSIGIIYLKKKLFPKAIENFRHAYNIDTTLKHSQSQIVWLRKLSDVYAEMGNQNKSKFYLKESKKIEETL